MIDPWTICDPQDPAIADTQNSTQGSIWHPDPPDEPAVPVSVPDFPPIELIELTDLRES